MAGLTRLPNTADHSAVMDAFNRDGGVIVENLFPAEVIGRMRDAVKRKAEASRPGSKSPEALWKTFHGENTIRFTGLGLIDPAFFDMLANPILKRVADDVLLSQFGSYWLNTGQTMIIGPGEPAQYLHRDCTNWTAYVKPMWPHCPEITVSTMIALEDMTEELGGTRVIPGSHLWEDFDQVGSPEQTVPTVMPAGSGMIYSGKVIHGGGANRTKDRWRFAMHISFVAGWLTPEEASALYYPSETIKALPERTQRLLGYRSYDPNTHFRSGRLWLKDFDTITDDA